MADQPSALFGECCFETGQSKITLGSGSFLSIITGFLFSFFFPFQIYLISIGKTAHTFSRNIFPVACWKMNGEIIYTTEGLKFLSMNSKK